MLDFLIVSVRSKKNCPDEVYPRFVVKRSNDLMIRGRDFYAVWVEERGLWSTDEQDALRMIDEELDKYAEANKEKLTERYKILHLWDAETRMIDAWHRFCQSDMRDNYHMLDEKLIFSNSGVNKKDYASKRLSYPLEAGECPAYEKLISTLYSEEERHKIEWSVGSIITGDSKKIQKFMVLYGAAGTGKSTILNIIQQLFEGYYSVFDARALGSTSNSFALEAFKTNPLVAIQHDGDLSKIEDNTRLNSLVSHEEMTINEKFKSTYSNRFKCFLFMGTNKPVKITDGKSGLIRRLIDVSPSGNKLNAREYRTAVKQVEFELGAIATHCQEVYLDDPDAYDDYIPIAMLGASNDFYNFVIDSYSVFLKEDGTTLKAAWEMYKTFCEEAKVTYGLNKRNFKEELKNYFWDFDERLVTDDGSRLSSYYSRFRTDKFEDEYKPKKKKEPAVKSHLIQFDAAESIFDIECADCFAQYATSNETPSKKWEKVKSKLSSLDTSQLHYVKVPENHIVIDFDIKDKDGNKSLEKNVEEASKWPCTYAELSKSGAGVHLHYIYSGDPSKLSRVYDDNIEIKVFTGNSSLRRKLTKCNNKHIATISSGLPIKGDDKVINKDAVTTEKGLRTLIKRNLNKEYHPGTKPSIDFINKILEDAYSGGVSYDVSDLKDAVIAFAMQSTNQADYCLKLVAQMKFKSEEPSVNAEESDSPIVFYDIEVFPNLFLVNWKIEGEGKPIVRMINPGPSEVEDLLRFKLVGFNCRRYDNHILYARLMGYDNLQLYNLSQKIIGSKKGDRNNGLFGEAYNLSYTDIYDFASAGNKKSLKKLEIEMGIHHQELGLPWDQPVPEELWNKVAEYCDNDVTATEAAFHYLSADWTARQILADLAGMTVNDTTNTLTTRIIFGSNKKPQDQFNYRDLSQPVGSSEYESYRKKFGLDYKFRIFDKDGQPIYKNYDPKQELPEGWSILPFFPGYKYDCGVSTYRGVEIGEGGNVYAEPGMYGGIGLLDIASMHPHSVLAEVLFGPVFTKAFEEIVYGRVNIKHEAWDIVDNMLGGKLRPYIKKVINGEMTSKDLANALKTAINSVYGLTAASFDNPFRDSRNKDNIVAKRGALFMENLKHAVQEQGFVVAHIKTDSIKIPDATPEIIKFVMDYGKEYGYTFEHEATYDKMCLVNDAVYIAKYSDDKDINGKHAGEWTATGKQFAVPYVFKKLFSREDIEFNDMCETFAVSKGDLYLDMNENLPDVEKLEKELAVITKGDREHERQEELKPLIAAGHDLKFVGRVGQFCPIVPGKGGGVLYRVDNGKNYAAPGSSGFRWLESEMVKGTNEEFIDRSFYDNLVDDAVTSISQYGDFEWFISEDQYVLKDIVPFTSPDYPECCPVDGKETCPFCDGNPDHCATCGDHFDVR